MRPRGTVADAVVPVAVARLGQDAAVVAALREQEGQVANVVKLILQRMETNVLKRFLQIALAMMTLGLTGCDEGKYPVSGEACGPDDLVQKLDANDCAVLPGV